MISKSTLNDKLTYICVDDKKIQLPEFVKAVPTIYLVTDQKVILDEEIGSSALAIPDKYGEEIESKTLEHLISLTNSPSKILKLDCEGCEYDIILNTPIDTLKKFQYIFVEYHDGHKNLERKLTECGFSVKNNTQNIYHRKHTNSRLYLGYLIATK